MPQVQVIQPIQQQPKRLRVAAYARVSSDSTDQLNSLSVQVDYYTHLIQENPNWDFAGIYWYPKTHQWCCRHCGMWSNRIRPEELSQQLREKLFWICRHNERICSPQGASNIHSIESSRLSHEINTLLASPEPDAESIVRKILHRAELQFTCCSAGDADPATLQIKRACNELEPTDTFPLKLYAEIVSNVILYRDTHIEIKLRNGQIL